VYLDSEIGDDATGTMQAPIAFSCDADETQSGPQHRSVTKMPVATWHWSQNGDYCMKP
jgi:hypothetical protein